MLEQNAAASLTGKPLPFNGVSSAPRVRPWVSLTPAQQQARRVVNGSAMHVLLFGGSRSGKTTFFVRNIILRALKAPGSRHAIFRQTRQALKESVWLDTFPKVMEQFFPGVPVQKHEQELYVTFPNGSEIWFGFLDDGKAADRVLGKEYNTIYFNECSEIPYGAVLNAQTRLALKNNLVNKFYYDCNPPGRWHWSYKLFIQKIDPKSGAPLAFADDYASFVLNPQDNADNLPPAYLRMLSGLPDDRKNRFLLGLWTEQIEGAVYGKELAQAEQELRIADVPHDPQRAVHTIWDIGTSDDTSIWLAQFYPDKIAFLEYLHGNFEGLPYYANLLKARPYRYGVHFFPHDGANKDWSTGRTRREAAIDLLPGEVEVLPRIALEDGINGARMLFPMCYFDRAGCADGLECLRNYRRIFDEKLGCPTVPLHDWASHGADAYRYACMAYNARLGAPLAAAAPRAAGLTFNDLMKKRSARRRDF